MDVEETKLVATATLEIALELYVTKPCETGERAQVGWLLSGLQETVRCDQSIHPHPGRWHKGSGLKWRNRG